MNIGNQHIQAQLGHSSSSVTTDTYGHLMKTVHRESAKRLDLAVFEKRGDNEEISGKQIETAAL